MSLYNVTVTNTSIGRAGTSEIMAIGFFPHTNEARQAIEQWANDTFVGPITVEVKLISHDNTFYPADVQGFERIVVIQ